MTSAFLWVGGFPKIMTDVDAIDRWVVDNADISFSGNLDPKKNPYSTKLIIYN